MATLPLGSKGCSARASCSSCRAVNCWPPMPARPPPRAPPPTPPTPPLCPQPPTPLYTHAHAPPQPPHFHSLLLSLIRPRRGSTTHPSCPPTCANVRSSTGRAATRRRHACRRAAAAAAVPFFAAPFPKAQSHPSTPLLERRTRWPTCCTAWGWCLRRSTPHAPASSPLTSPVSSGAGRQLCASRPWLEEARAGHSRAGGASAAHACVPFAARCISPAWLPFHWCS
jgi:hypothetical protein